MNQLADAALLLGRRGNRVFPVGADKAPLTPRGFHDGTADLDRITGWERAGLWKGGIGLVIPDRVFVVDIDPRNGGTATWNAAQSGKTLPGTRTVRTQSGGVHLYFALPDDRDTRGKLGPGVDIKKPGRGYVLVPPTPGYSFLRGGNPSPAPQWLLNEITIVARDTSPGGGSAPKYFVGLQKGTAYALATLTNAVERLLAQDEGGRRALLNAESYTLGRLSAAGELDGDYALEALLEAALESGLDEAKALKVIHDGWHAGEAA